MLKKNDRVVYKYLLGDALGYPHLDGRTGTVRETADRGTLVFVRFDYSPAQIVCYDTELTKIGED